MAHKPSTGVAAPCMGLLCFPGYCKAEAFLGVELKVPHVHVWITNDVWCWPKQYTAVIIASGGRNFEVIGCAQMHPKVITSTFLVFWVLAMDFA